MKVFSLDKFKDPLSSFWVLQLIGWTLYGVLIYITFLTVVSAERQVRFVASQNKPNGGRLPADLRDEAHLQKRRRRSLSALHRAADRDHVVCFWQSLAVW
jgi:hypothetical protein